MSKHKKALYLTQDIRLCERQAQDELGIAASDLMLNAGTAAFKTLKTLYPDVRNIAVFCGGGNNAGDAYVLAHLAHNEDFSVVIYPYQPIERLPPVAKQAALNAIAAGVFCHALDDLIDSDIELVIDGLLGIGLKGAIRGPIAHAISLINESNLPVLALDIPSGLDADTGQVLGVCIHAAVTTTFIAEKVGLYLLDGPDHCGKIVCHSLHLDNCVAALPPAGYQMEERFFHGILPSRRKNSHKGIYGHVLVIGGGAGMPGAPHLVAHAAMRTGAGAVTIATLPEHAGKVLPELPEAMIYGIHDVDSLLPLLEKATIAVIGPGLGDSEWAQSLFGEAIAAQLPLVIDASALRMLAHNQQHDDNWVLTPHPGEAACLLDCLVADVQVDRRQAALMIQKRYGGCVVLKGVGTIVSTEEQDSYICTEGNPGMATAGMGDVLSGVIAGLLAQGMPLADAAKFGVWLHARAADEAVSTQGERGLMASDLMPYIRRQLNKCT